MVQPLDGEGVAQRLRLVPVRDAAEGVVQLLEGQTSLLQLARQPVVPIAIELQAKGRPGRHPQIAQAKLLVQEIEVIVQALAILVAQRRLATRLVMPGHEGRAGFHRREDVHQARLQPSHRQHGFDPVFLAKRAHRANELDRDALLTRKLLGVGPDLLPQRLGKAWVVEQPHVMYPQIGRHPFRITDPRQCAGNDQPVIAGQDAGNLAGIAFRQQRHASAPFLSTRRSTPSICQHTHVLVSALPS